MSQRKSKNTRQSKSRQSQHGIQLLINILMRFLVLLNVIVALVMCCSAYAHYAEPDRHQILPLLALSFDYQIVIYPIFTIIWLLLCQWRKLLISLLPYIVCISQVQVFAPMAHINHASQSRPEASFTLLSYNIMGWADYEKRQLDYSPQAATVIARNADYVALQECYAITPGRDSHISQSQADTLASMYPHHVISPRDLAFLSKYPIIECTNLTGDNDEYAAARYRVLSPVGDTITIYNLHLQSMGLNSGDRNTYRSIVSRDMIHNSTDSSLTFLKSASKLLLPKIAQANAERAKQARGVRSWLNGEHDRLIVCGDFNDVHSSYAYNKVRGKMNDLYADCAYGPTITYHASRLYFRIDHILYDGRLNPISIQRVHDSGSDHYAMHAKFETLQ